MAELVHEKKKVAANAWTIQADPVAFLGCSSAFSPEFILLKSSF
tara:strand:+ start:103 stop:234 length:132 start_codon:yes stop_codon:yes gene_type:complete